MTTRLDGAGPPQTGIYDDLLVVEDLHVEFSVDGQWSKALRGVDLALRKGDSLALVGESGSGKSVTAISIIGLLPRNGRRTRGRVSLGGADLTSMSPSDYRRVRGREIGFVFQDPLSSLNPVLSVGRQLTEQMEVHGIASSKSARGRAADLLERVGIADPANALARFPFEFSGGMRQRIALAIALSCEPSLLIADEPTTALDVTVQAQILDLLREIQEERQLGMIFITHDLSVASIVADRVAVMYAGQVVESGAMSDIAAGGRHPYTRGLWKSMPSLESAGIPEGIPGRPPLSTELNEGCSFGPRCQLFTEGLCDLPQDLITVAPGHDVRCVRWEAVV